MRPAFELVLDGFTFDLFFDPVTPGHMYSRYGNAQDSAAAGFMSSGCALVLVPGPHLAGSEGMLLIVRTQWALAARLAAQLPQIAGAGWPPSANVLGAEPFIAAAEGWAQGGPMPLAGLITFHPVLGNALHSAGLAHFTSQEVRLEPELAALGDDATRLGQQIAQMLMHRGPLREAEQFTSPGGEIIRLEPSVNGRFVRVWAG